MCKPSFIDESSLTKYTTSDFIAIVYLIYKLNLPKELKNLDLSEVDFSGKNNLVNRNFDKWNINNVIFSRFNPDVKKKKHLFGLSFKGAKLKNVGFTQAFLDKCNFDLNKKGGKIITKLNCVDFFFSEFSYCHFCGCYMDTIDFRYTKISDCSMRNINVTFGDFYFCNFMGCSSFQESTFNNCSFTNAVFEHTVIREKSIKGILQNNYDNYEKIVIKSNKWFRYNPTGDKSQIGMNKEEVLDEAVEMYKQLSGIYAGKGLNKDSNEAYRKMRNKEMQKNFLPIMELLSKIGRLIKKIFLPIKKLFKYIGRLIYGPIIALFGYGYRLRNAFFLFAALIILGALLFHCSDNKSTKISYCCCCDSIEHKSTSFCEAVSYSVYNSVGSYVEEYVNTIGPFWTAVLSLFGLGLIAYIGFIFANKMRNNL